MLKQRTTNGIVGALVAAGLCVSATAGWAQSTWRPSTTPRNPTPPSMPIPKMPRIDPPLRLDKTLPQNAKKDSAEKKLVPAAADTAGLDLLLRGWIGPMAPLFKVGAGRLGIRDRTAVMSDQYTSTGGGGSAPTSAVAPAGGPRTYPMDHAGRSTFDIYAAAYRPDLTDFLDVFVAEELNGGDTRNHEPLTWTTGAGGAYRYRLTRRWGLQFHADFARGRTTDRQTWGVREDPEGPTSIVRDEQNLEIKHGAVGADLVREGSWKASRWTMYAGAELGWNRLAIDYSFDGQQQYAFETGWAISPGARAGGSLTAMLTDRTGIRLAAGYRYMARPDLSINGEDWYWVRADASRVRAGLEMSGVFLGAGVEYLF